ncbi:MAG: NTP transferase domain-containing protein [Erythrobacter sp.]|jgi:GTP:adenosylcobinamide-phosphate guanylyltransferase|nr:NTP transferase domain-containing protein [Erythrobacter sp.]
MAISTLNEAGQSVRWTAIVLAGQRPEGDALATQLGVPAKALIGIEGRTMLARVVDALLATPEVARVLVLAQQPDVIANGEPSDILNDGRVTLAASGNGIAASIALAIDKSEVSWPVLVTTADNALLTSGRVSALLREARGVDLALGVGKRSIVDAVFPDTKRSWLKFADGHFSGANLFALAHPRCLPILRHWQAIEQDRKKGLKLFASFGPILFLQMLTRTIALQRAVTQVSAKMGFTAKAVILDAEAPIDVDKIEDLVLVKRILARRLKG